MSFTLRQTTPRVGGGEPIERVRPLATDEPVIGRGADCDIHLPDLAVSLRHARLREVGPGRVQIESLGDLPFEIGGRFVRAAEVRPAGAPTVLVGNHVLTLTAGAAPGEVVVAVERRQGGRAMPSAEDERAVFSPPAAVLGKRRLAWTFGLGILLACLVLPVAAFFVGQNRPTIHADQQWSSGPVSKVHGYFGAKCQMCHQQAFVAVRDDACLACHGRNRDRASILRTAAEARAAGNPLAPRLIGDHAAHGRLGAATPLPSALGARIAAIFERAFHHPEDRCASCHLEHFAADQTVRRGPALARRPRPIPLLATVHACADCHAGLKARLADTPLLNVHDWGRHPDFRPVLVEWGPGARPRLERIALARRPHEEPGLAFSHRLHLAPAGAVARMAQVLGSARGYGPPLACANCHRRDGAGRGFVPVEMVRDCSACHSLAFARRGGVLQMLPHGSVARLVARLEAFYPVAPNAYLGDGRRIPGLAAEILQWWRRSAPPSTQAAAAIRATFAPGGVCSCCHAIGRPRAAASLAYGIAPVRLTQRYLPRGAFDHGVAAHHQDAQGRPTCGVCHGARLSDRAGDVLIPRIAQCAACHGRSRAQTSLAAAADCAECHSYHVPGAPTSRTAIQEWADPGRPAAVRSGASGLATLSWAQRLPALLNGTPERVATK